MQFWNNNLVKNHLPLILQFLVALAHEVSSDVGLEHSDDFSEAFVPHLFQHTEDASLKEDLGVTEAVLGRIQL